MELSNKMPPARRYETLWEDGMKVTTIVQGGVAHDLVEWPEGQVGGCKMCMLEPRPLTGLELLCLGGRTPLGATTG